jgi:hypothetical protein
MRGQESFGHILMAMIDDGFAPELALNYGGGLSYFVPVLPRNGPDCGLCNLGARETWFLAPGGTRTAAEVTQYAVGSR